MPSTLTSNVGLEKQATGENENTWGILLNQVLDQIDRLTGGHVSIDVGGGVDVSLSSSQSQRRSLTFTGVLTANINVILPANGQGWIVRNSTTGNFTLTVKTAAGTGVVIAQSDVQFIEGDGTNIVSNRFVTQDGRQNFAVTGGSANAYTLTVYPAIAAYVIGQKFRAKASFSISGTTTPTIVVSGLAALNLTKNGVAAAVGDINSGDIFEFSYDGTNAELSPTFRSVVQATGNYTLSGTNTWSGPQTWTGTNTMGRLAMNNALDLKDWQDIATSTTGTTDIGTATSNLVRLTGTQTVSDLGTAAAGVARFIRAGGALTINAGTKIITPGTTSFVYGTSDDTLALALSRGAGVWVFAFLNALMPASQAAMEAAASLALGVTPGRQQYHPLHPKAMVFFNGTTTGTQTTFGYSVGVSNVIRLATGRYTITFSTAFSGTTSVGMMGMAGGAGANGFALSTDTAGTPTTTSFPLRCWQSGVGNADNETIFAMFWGDQ